MNRVLQPFEIFTKTSGSVCIWLNGEPTAIGRRAERIWNEATYRVATDGAVNEILRRKEDVEWPHVICGDFDSIDKGIDMKMAERIHLPNQDHTDLTKASQWCLDQRVSKKWAFERIVVLGGLNGRFDHTMSTLSFLIHFVDSQTPIVVVDSNNLVAAVQEGISKIHVDLSRTTKMCGVIPICQKSTVVTSTGLKYEMAELPLEFGKLISSSNEVTTAQITLNTTASLIFTIELIKEPNQ